MSCGEAKTPTTGIDASGGDFYQKSEHQELSHSRGSIPAGYSLVPPPVKPFLMTKTFRAGIAVLTAIGLMLGAGNLKGAVVTTHVTGTFDVKLTPQAADDKAEGAALGRMSIEKTYHGDLEATAKGEMLTAGSSVKESGVYVAVERVTGVLQGRSGTLALYHSGVMTRGIPQLSISVVPDSGTGQLAGISGTMTINIVDGKHFYEFDFTLDAR